MKTNRIDYILSFSIFILSLIGIVMVLSSTTSFGLKYGDSLYFLKRHVLYLLLGLLALYMALKIDLKILRKYSFWILLFSMLLLFVVFIPPIGQKISGAWRWINLYFFSFQPSEITKLALIIFLSNALSNKKNQITGFIRGLLPLLLVVVAVCFLILKEPDLGTSLMIFITSFIMFFIAGAKLSHLAAIVVPGIIAVTGLVVSAPYRLRRVFAFLDPWQDPYNVGFQIIQSLLAVGSGGIFGLGLGNSRQKFFYLPQQYADFILAVFAEELGLIGMVSLLAVFLVFFLRGYKIALEAKEPFQIFLAAGITTLFFVQTFINFSVVLGLLPTTGLPLPFVSYGGTSLIVNFFAVGILLNISRERKIA